MHVPASLETILSDFCISQRSTTLLPEIFWPVDAAKLSLSAGVLCRALLVLVTKEDGPRAFMEWSSCYMKLVVP